MSFSSIFFYFIKKEKILSNWCFISIDYIEFLSPITTLLPSLGIESLNDLESNSKWGPCYSRKLEIFSIQMSSDVQSNLLIIDMSRVNLLLK